MKKRMLALLLAGIMVLSATACGNSGVSSKDPSTANPSTPDQGQQEETTKTDAQVGIEVFPEDQGPPPADAPVGGQVVIGISPGSLSPDMMSGWSNGATNSGFLDLMSGYSLATYDRNNVYMLDPVVVKDHEIIKNEDGSKTYRFVINENLKWSDGTPITAKDYVFNLLLCSSPEYVACEADAMTGWALVGFEEHNTGAAKEFAGVRLLGDYEFSLTIKASELPNYFELANVGYGPMPLHAIAPGADVKDDGNGAYMTEEFTEDLIRKTLLDPETGFRYKNPVVSGPYKLKSIDLTTETVTLEINEEYIGTYDGTKPHIQTVISKPVATETMRDEFEKGNIDFYSAGSGEKIDAALTKVESGEMKANYGIVPGTRITEIRFQCDFGPTQFEEVRRAVAYITDRDELSKQLTGGYGKTIDCYATEASSNYLAIKDQLEPQLIHYSYDIEKAKQELINGGWTLNENGQEFQEGVDKYRYKMVDGELMKLKIEVACGEDEYSKLYNTVIPPEAEKIGMEWKYTTMDFALQLNHMNRDGVDLTYHVYFCSVGMPEILFFWYIFDDNPETVALWNPYYISDPELKAIAKEMQKIEPENTDAFREKYGEFQKLFNKKLPGLPMEFGVSYSFFNPKLKNCVPRAYAGWSDLVLDSYIEE